MGLAFDGASTHAQASGRKSGFALDGDMDQLGRYELGPVIGVGGAGRVHRAERVGPGALRTAVALKVLRSGGPELAREAGIAALLRHRNLVDVYEVGEVDGTWFCAMELCLGSLAEHVPLSPRAVVEVGMQVCAALQYAHDTLGLVHQDLKPRNLLLHVDGSVKVADLGIARAEGFDLQGIRGTPGYAAPEQVFGSPVDARADIYALGVTLSELATGQRGGGSSTLVDTSTRSPDTASTLSLEDLGRSDDPTEVGTPAWLQPAVARCLAADPADRWPTMRALSRALSALDAPGPGLSAIVGPPRPEAPTLAEAGVLVGRQAELEALERFLEEPGLLAVLGAAGVGKSRTVAVAAEAFVGRGGHTWRVELSDVSTVSEVCAAVARVVDVPLNNGAPEVQLGRVLAMRGAGLLLLDNAGQVPGLPTLLQTWTRAAPVLRLWVTSREALGLGQVLRIETLPEADAVALLVARARQRGVDVAGDPRLLELAQQLDGVPLALELAAGRLGVLSTSDVLERLDFDLLRAGTEGRHSTLLSVLEGSWAQLSAPFQSALAQLSVFVDGFRLDAAEAVLELDDLGALDAVAGLVDRSLVTTGRDGRLRLLSTVRTFAAERLTVLGQTLRTEARHGAWAASLHRVAPWGSVLQLRTTAAEIHNLAAALRRAVARADADTALAAMEGAMVALGRRGPAAMVVELAEELCTLDLDTRVDGRVSVDMARALWGVGRPQEALVYGERALASALAAPDRVAEAGARRVRGALLRQLGRSDEAEVEQEAALALYRELGDRVGQAISRDNLGLLHLTQGRTARALTELEASLELSRTLGNRNTEGSALGHLALVHDAMGDQQRAESMALAALAVHRQVGDRRREGQTLGNLGALWRGMGRPAAARRAYLEALDVHREVGNRRFEGIVLGNLGTLSKIEGDGDRARAHWEAALAVHREVGNPSSESIVLGNLADLCLALGELKAAGSHCRAAVALADAVGERRVSVWLWTLQARILHASGRSAAALELLAEALPVSHQVGDQVLQSVLQSSRAIVLASVGRTAEATEALAQAEATAPSTSTDAHAAIAEAREALHRV